MIDLFAPGIYLRCPGGNVERPELHKLAADWAALNLGSDPCVQSVPGVWNLQRQLYRQSGFPHYPWLHCRTIADVKFLILIAEDWLKQGAAPVIGLNLENVVGDNLSLQEVARVVLDLWVKPHGGQVHLATLPWVQNGQGWGHLNFAVAALEIFPDEQKSTFPNGYDEQTVEECIDHAHAEGLEKITLMLKTKDYAPVDYGVYWRACHSLYTADDIPPLLADWAMWKQVQPCERLTKEVDVSLTPVEAPFTGPYFGPSHPKGPMKGPTAKALKRFAIRMELMTGDLKKLDEHYNAKLETAIKIFQADFGGQRSGQYGKATWTAVRAARVPAGPHKGEYALDNFSQKLIRDEYEAAKIKLCYPIALGDYGVVCQTLHRTAGDTSFAPNWAYDFCAPPGTPILVVENATISKLSGSDPDDDLPDGSGTFGWNIHYETPAGYHWFWTHFGKKANLSVGQKVEMGHVIGWIGDQEFRPDHVHGGVTSPKGSADGKAKIAAVAAAPRISAL